MAAWRLLLPLLIGAYYQLIPPHIAHTFVSTGPCLTFVPSEDEFCSLTYSAAYAITAWVLFDPTPTSAQEIFQVRGPSLNAILAFRNPNGSVVVYIKPYCYYYPLAVSGFSTPEWVHIGISISSYSEIVISAIDWDGQQYLTVQPTTLSFPITGPDLNPLISLGGGSVADTAMADARFYTSSLSAAQMVVIANAGICPSECFGACFGPTITECSYVDISSRDTVITATTAGVSDWNYITPDEDDKYGFTGWFFFTESDTGTRTLCRFTYTLADCCTVGDRVMLLLLIKNGGAGSLSLHFDTNAGPNQFLPALALPVGTI